MEGKSRAVCKFGPVPCALPPPGLWPAALGLPVAVPTAVPEHMCAEYVQADFSAGAAEMFHESEMGASSQNRLDTENCFSRLKAGDDPCPLTARLPVGCRPRAFPGHSDPSLCVCCQVRKHLLSLSCMSDRAGRAAD